MNRNQPDDHLQWALPNTRDITRDTLMARIDIYEESVLLHSYHRDRTTVQYVSPDDMATIISNNITHATGVLPPDTLWWNRGISEALTGIWRPPQTWSVALQTQPFSPPERYRLPMPGLVFVCSPGRPPWVFAAKQRPTAPTEQLYHAPTFNLFQDGRSCPGTHQYPGDIGRTPESFFQSFFSVAGHTTNRSLKHPNDLHQLWKELDETEKYPLRDLVECCTLQQAMQTTGG